MNEKKHKHTHSNRIAWNKVIRWSNNMSETAGCAAVDYKLCYNMSRAKFRSFGRTILVYYNQMHRFWFGHIAQN